MDRELLISASPGEWRGALLEDGVPVELYVERGDRAEIGSIHLGRVIRLLPALGAALVDINEDRPAFLPQREVFPRGRQLYEGERLIVQIRREAQAGKSARVGVAPRPSGLQTDIPLAGDWQEILDRAARLEPPARLNALDSFAARFVHSLSEVADRIIVDEPAAVPEIRAAFTGCTIAYRAETEWPFDLDAAFDEVLSETVPLPGGGSIHFEATRAGTMIDVDTGTPETGSPQRTGLNVNIAAARSIPRQIRLRNLSGGIVVDFVGLESRPARDKIRASLADAIATDPRNPQLLGWTRLGHFELVRPRRGRPLGEALLESRLGGPLIKTAVTVAHEALRGVRRAARGQPGQQWRLVAAPEVAAALAGVAADAVQEAARRFARGLAIEADPAYGRERFEIWPM